MKRNGGRMEWELVGARWMAILYSTKAPEINGL